MEELSVITSDGRRPRNDGECVRTVLRDKFVVAVDEDAPDSDVIVLLKDILLISRVLGSRLDD